MEREMPEVLKDLENELQNTICLNNLILEKLSKAKNKVEASKLRNELELLIEDEEALLEKIRAAEKDTSVKIGTVIYDKDADIKGEIIDFNEDGTYSVIWDNNVTGTVSPNDEAIEIKNE